MSPRSVKPTAAGISATQPPGSAEQNRKRKGRHRRPPSLVTPSDHRGWACRYNRLCPDRHRQTGRPDRPSKHLFMHFMVLHVARHGCASSATAIAASHHQCWLQLLPQSSPPADSATTASPLEEGVAEPLAIAQIGRLR